LDGLFRPGNRFEHLEAAESQLIALAVIRADLVQADPAEAPRHRDREYIHGVLSLALLFFSRRSISVHEAQSSEPLTAQLFR
jgi:hypothetical protein